MMLLLFLLSIGCLIGIVWADLHDDGHSYIDDIENEDWWK